MIISTRLFCGSRTTRSGGNEKVGFAETADSDRIGRHAIADQFGGNDLRTAGREALVVARGA